MLVTPAGRVPPHAEFQMAKAPPDDLAREIDRLLKQLPKGDPMLKGTPPPLSAQPFVPSPTDVGTVPAPKARVAREARTEILSVSTEHLAVWARLLLAAGLGVAVAFWPYANSCGWGLYLYLFVVASVIIAGGWASVEAWRVRIAPAHVAALVVAYWGIVLAAEQILPRIEYAAESAAWVCGR